MNQVWKTLYEKEHRSLGKNGEATLTPLWSKSPQRRGALLKGSHLGELSIKDSPPSSMMENHHSSRLLQSTQKSPREKQAVKCPVCVCNRRKQGQVKISLERPQKEESEPMHKVYLSQNPQIQGAFYFLVSIYQSEQKKPGSEPETKAATATPVCCHLGAALKRIVASIWKCYTASG